LAKDFEDFTIHLTATMIGEAGSMVSKVPDGVLKNARRKQRALAPAFPARAIHGL
jgi:hypothetical protein